MHKQTLLFRLASNWELYVNFYNREKNIEYVRKFWKFDNTRDVIMLNKYLHKYVLMLILGKRLNIVVGQFSVLPVLSKSTETEKQQ